MNWSAKGMTRTPDCRSTLPSQPSRSYLPCLCPRRVKRLSIAVPTLLLHKAPIRESSAIRGLKVGHATLSDSYPPYPSS